MGDVTKAGPLPKLSDEFYNTAEMTQGRVWTRVSKEGRHRFRKKDAFSFIQK